MLKYKILIAVTAESEKFKNCVSKCPDKSKLVIINNWRNPDVKKQCDALKKQGSEVQDYPMNLGCGPSMNIGLRKIYSDKLDYVIILSPSALFKNSIQDFIDIIEEKEKTEKNYYYMTISTYKTDLHAFAVMKKCVDEVGLYDENFYPVYYDDTDYGYRMGLIGAVKTLCYPDRVSQDLGGGVKHDTELFDLYWHNVNHIHDYYVRKWGGEHTFETFKTPFNDPTKSIKDWVREEEKMITFQKPIVSSSNG